MFIAPMPPSTPAPAPAPAPAPLPPPPTATELAFTRVVVRHGLTINMGNYQSAKVDVELESSTMTAEQLGVEVRKQLMREAKPWFEAAEKGAK